MADNETKKADAETEVKVPAKKNPLATEKYRLMKGKHLGPDPENPGEDKVFKPGDWIELNAAQAKNFGDKVKSQRVLRAEAAAYDAADEDHVDSTQQPIATLGPVDEDTNEAANPKDAESQAKQTTQPTGGDGTTTPPQGSGAAAVAPTGTKPAQPASK